MPPENSQDFLVQENLKSLGISLLSEWDVLVFLYRRGTSLTSAAQIAHLLGYNRTAVSAALDRLASLELIHRSRGSQGVRLYRYSAPPDPSRDSCIKNLMGLAVKRSGRLLLLKYLQHARPEPVYRAHGLRLA